MSGRKKGPRMTGKPTPARLKIWVDSVSSATLPLLAGFSTTAVIVVSDDAANFRWPGATILVLAIAAVVLILALSFHRGLGLGGVPDVKSAPELGQ